MANTRPTGMLNIGKLYKPTSSSFDHREKAVIVWLSDLPMADIGNCGKQIYAALQEVNRYDIPYNSRLRFLELLIDPVANILQALKRHYVMQSIPLSEKNKQISELAVALNMEIAQGYKIIIEQLWVKPISFMNKKRITAAIHHAMHYLNNVLLISYQTYEDHPYNTWMHIHQLYLYAKQNHISDTTIKKQHGANFVPANSIETLYKQILLLGLISPYRLKQPITEKVYNLLESWGQMCVLLPVEEYSLTSKHVIIQQNTDTTPCYYNNQSVSSRIYSGVLDTSGLTHYLSGFVMNHDSQQSLSKADELSSDVLRLLLITWSGKSKRAFARTLSQDDNQLSVTLGLSATHKIIKQLGKSEAIEEAKSTDEDNDTPAKMPPGGITRRLAPGEDDVINKPANFSRPLFGVDTQDSRTPDVWDADYASKTISYDYNLKINSDTDAPVEVTQQKIFEPHNYDNFNESADGYCLISPKEALAPKVQVGDLMGILNKQPQEDDTLAIGVIRRLKNKHKQVEIGVQKLAPFAEAIATSKYATNLADQSYTRSLMLPEMKSINRPNTIVTHDLHKVNNELIINKQGFKTLIKLTRLIEATGSFSQFEFRVIKTLGIDEYGAKENNYEIESAWSLI